MTASPLPRLVPAALVAASLAAGLGACSPGVDRVITHSAPSSDSSKRHPIVLAHTPTSLDVFAEGPTGLDLRQRSDLAAFVGDYRANGGGIVEVRVPDQGPARVVLDGVRSSLAGLPLDVRPYRVADPTLAAPIRLSFVKLQARVPHTCGQWPDDLGGASTLVAAENRPWWNLGCAVQANIAAQVADPRDLVRPRSETEVDVNKRTRAVEDLRKAKDPSTDWKTVNQRISNGVGN